MTKIKAFVKKLKKTDRLHQGFLLSDEAKLFAFEKFEKTRISKLSIKENKENNIQHSIIFDENGKMFAIYNPEGKDGVANGAFGTIKIAQNMITGEWCLVKIQKIGNQNKKCSAAIQRMRNEKGFLQKFNTLQGYQERISEKTNQFVSYTFMEELPGLPILDGRHPGNSFVATKRKFLNEQERLFLLRNLLVCLYKLQEENIIHRDLSGHNILINDDLQVYFIDWGSALNADASGFCRAIPEQLGAIPKEIRYANGYDFIRLLDSFSELELLNDEEIRTEILEMKGKCGHPKKGYNAIDVLPLIKKIDSKISFDFQSCKPRH